MSQQHELKTYLQVRLPVELAIKLRENAASNMRSLNNQIIFYVEKGVAAERASSQSAVSQGGS